jgi:uncharacterized membrane protein YhhN
MAAGVRLIATIVCAVACAVLVLAESRGSKLRFVAKPIASAAFIVVGLGAPRWVLAGLVLGAVGDLALLFPRGFLAGLGAFLLGHLAYAIAFPPTAPLWLVPPAAGGVLALIWLWPHLGSMRIPVIAYVLAIVAMVGGALATNARLLELGAVAFFLSDLSVARDKFIAPGFANKAWGLPAYYGGQLLIAWSMVHA